MPTTGRSHPSLDVLARKIDQLGDECPWTAAQRPEDMLFHLRSEIMETEAALREKSVDREALTKELGDVLFCALLLARVCEREHGASLPAVADAAVAKLRRRAPYVFGGPPATTLEEAERQWLDGKAAEKAVEAPAPTPAPAPAVAAPPPAVAAPPAAAAADADSEDEPLGLSEWEKDFRDAAGPADESDSDDD